MWSGLLGYRLLSWSSNGMQGCQSEKASTTWSRRLRGKAVARSRPASQHFPCKSKSMNENGRFPLKISSQISFISNESSIPIITCVISSYPMAHTDPFQLYHSAINLWWGSKVIHQSVQWVFAGRRGGFNNFPGPEGPSAPS